MLLRFFTRVIERIAEWWTRSFWGWLVVLGPMLSYIVLLISLDVVGLGSADPLRYLPADGDATVAFVEPEKLIMFSVAGRLEYAIVSSIFFLVACFSIIWSVPKVFLDFRNPFGGLTGVAISLGSSAFLYYLYMVSDYNLRQVFADDILVFGENAGVLQPILVSVQVFGFQFFSGEMMPSAVMSSTRDLIYAVGNAAPWCLIVLAANSASYEPRSFREESHASLRARVMTLQIAVVLAAANIVLSVVYTRAMVDWPPMLLESEISHTYAVATSRYTALWGALGSVLLITALAPAYISLERQFDRVAMRELGAERGRRITYAERMAWRQKHGLVVSAQQAVTTGAAVLAPLMTSPTLDAQQGGDRAADGAGVQVQEIPFDQR